MRSAKANGGASHAFFEARMMNGARDQLDLLRDLKLDAVRSLGREDAIRLARKAGVWTVVTGRITGLTDSTLVVASVYDVASGKKVDSAMRSMPRGADPRPLFDALDGLPLAVVRGANSILLAAETVARMRERRPDLIVAEVPDRGHVPFLDEPEALSALEALLVRVGV